jgi:hypothetical protein
VTTPNDPTMSHSSLDAVIAAYILGAEAGVVPNRQELLDQHPEHVDALHAFFDADPKRIVLWSQVITGQELDEQEKFHILDVAVWRVRKGQLDRLGWPQFPPPLDSVVPRRRSGHVSTYSRKTEPSDLDSDFRVDPFAR